MVSDEPRVANLVVENESYGKDGLFVLTTVRPKIAYYQEQDHAVGPPVRKQMPAVDAKSFYQKISTSGSAEKLHVSERLALDERVLPAKNQ